jgi:hypothetical protein
VGICRASIRDAGLKGLIEALTGGVLVEFTENKYVFLSYSSPQKIPFVQKEISIYFILVSVTKYEIWIARIDK